MNELKPCPFCGCKNTVAAIDFHREHLFIFCKGCCARMELGFKDANGVRKNLISFEEVITAVTQISEAWNRRRSND